MSNLVYLATLVGGALTLLIARYLREPSPGLSSAEGHSIAAGILTGIVVAFSQGFGPRSAIETGLVIAVTSLYLRSRLRVDDFSGLITGSLAGISGAVTIVAFRSPDGVFDLIRRGPGSESHQAIVADAAIVLAALPAATMLTSAVRGRSPYRTAILVAISSGCVVSSLVAFLLRAGVDPGHLTIVVLAIPPLILLGSVFLEWPVVTRELEDEARLDLLPLREVPGIAHPIRRLGRGGWRDLDARRKLISRATELAMAKHRQRQMSDEAARLYQLEIMKLRMDIREILAIHQALVLDAEDSSRVESTSDTMSNERATPH